MAGREYAIRFPSAGMRKAHMLIRDTNFVRRKTDCELRMQHAACGYGLRHAYCQALRGQRLQP